MGRLKAISDDQVLDTARTVFSEHGHAAATRDVAKAAGLSEGVLYQRFGSKDALFFAAMKPAAPNIGQIFGPDEARGNPQLYVRKTVVRLAEYFASVLPLVMRVMTHPSFELEQFAAAKPLGVAAQLEEALRIRLSNLQKRGETSNVPPRIAARLLISLAHDWGLRACVSADPPAQRKRELEQSVDAAWCGLGSNGKQDE